MRITGGSYGAGGQLRVFKDCIKIEGAVNKTVFPADIQNTSTTTRSEKSFSIIAFLIWCLVFCFLGFVIFGPVGSIIGFFVAIAASFSKNNVISVDVRLKDGSNVVAEGWHFEVQKLTKMPLV